jgi:glycosyltransferase involved in cell wall biosynthesis
MRIPAVSVVIPAFNAAEHLPDALRSIRNQTMTDVEVIVVDDGSTDDTVGAARQFSDQLQLTILQQNNAGPAAARNNGIRHARGRYCAFLDSDDVMLPERLAKQSSLLDRESDLGLVHTDLMTFDDGGIIHHTRLAFSNPCGGMVLDRLLLDNFITTSTVMAPKATLLEVGLFGEARRVSEDFELWLKIAARWKVAFIEQPLVRYRRRANSLSADKLFTARCALDVVEAFWREHPQHRATAPGVYRDSVAQHLATVGSAALHQGHRGRALNYLARSLRLDPWKRQSWKSLVKVLVLRMPEDLVSRPGSI